MGGGLNPKWVADLTEIYTCIKLCPLSPGCFPGFLPDLIRLDFGEGFL